MKRKKLIYAVDFDGTLCENKWPEIGAPNLKLIEYLRSKRKLGHRVILWTCRVDEKLEKAVLWCKSHDLEFDAINENLPDIIKQFSSDSRKIFANVYIDDRITNDFKLPYFKEKMVFNKRELLDICEVEYNKGYKKATKDIFNALFELKTGWGSVFYYDDIVNAANKFGVEVKHDGI